MVDFEDDILENSLSLLLKRLNEKYECIGCGRNRIVFKTKNGKYVIKIPRNMMGITDNAMETQKLDFGFPVSKSKRIILNDFCCVIAEYVDPVSGISGLPEWTKYVDCQQVGYTRKNILVAYDYA